MKLPTSSEAQVSLELILVMSVFFSVMLLFVPLVSKTFFLGIYSMDVSRAKSFSDSIEVSAAELNSMSNGSKIILSAQPLTEWRIECRNGKTFLKVIMEKYGGEKELISETFALADFSRISFKEKTLFSLTKTEKGVLLAVERN